MIKWEIEKMEKHSEALIRLLSTVPAKELLDAKDKEMRSILFGITDLLNNCGAKPGIAQMIEREIIKAIKASAIIGGTSALMAWVQTARVSLTLDQGDNPLGDAHATAQEAPESTISPEKVAEHRKPGKPRLSLDNAFCRVCRRLLEVDEIIEHPGICRPCLDEMTDEEE